MTYQPEVVSEIIQTALSKPRDLGEDYATWTLDRLVDYLHRVKGIRMKRSRISEIFLQEGLSWQHEESWFGERVDPDFARKRGAITSLYTAPPERSVTVCLDEMGPQAVKSYPGKQLVYPEAAETKPAGRAKQAIDYGRRGKAGYVFGDPLLHVLQKVNPVDELPTGVGRGEHLTIGWWTTSIGSKAFA